MKQRSFCGIFESDRSEPARFTLLGLPYDTGSSFRPGARLGPSAIREMAASLNSCTEAGVDLSGLDAVDAGDLPLSVSAKHAHAQIASRMGELLDEGSVPIVLGGDHSVTVPCFEAALQRHPNLTLLTFDAHPDLYSEFDGDPFSHACVTHRCLQLPGMNGNRITQVGVRATTPVQQAAAARHGVRTVPAWEAVPAVFDTKDPVYVSFDIDVLDPAFAPGCGNPVPGGLTTREAIEWLHAIRAPVVALDVVEVNPLLDPQGITALAAARLVVEALGAIVHRVA